MRRGYRYREQRNAAVRRYRRSQKVDPSVYGVWFPVAQVLKVGYASHRNNSIFVSYIRTRARSHGINAVDGACIWKMPGDLRAEAWMQATLSFQWHPAFRQAHGGLCEWFLVPGLDAEEVCAVLDSVHRQMPEDLVGDVSVMMPSGPAALRIEPVPAGALF